MSFESIDAAQAALQSTGYVPSRELAAAVFLAARLQRPLFLEGEPGTGKTELAKALAASLGRPLIRLQCFEGLDLTGAAYEWNYARQMLAIKAEGNEAPRAGQARPAPRGGARKLGAARRSLRTEQLFSREFLIPRALLQALESQPAAVLLIDELDRADEPFEAFLLELLGEWQLTIPELGVVRAAEPPLTIITSNRTREIHDAVKRRCLYHWLDHPSAETELAILRSRVPEAPAQLAREVVAFVQALRAMDLYKLPGVAETIEWSRALLALDATSLDPLRVQESLGLLLKYQDDIARVQGGEIAQLLDRVRSG